MEAKELRQFGADELKGRVRQWREELFRSRFKGQTTETRDTSTCKKIKRDIARALTVLNEKTVAESVANADQVSVGKVAKATKTAKSLEGNETKTAKTKSKKKDLKAKASGLAE